METKEMTYTDLLTKQAELRKALRECHREASRQRIDQDIWLSNAKHRLNSEHSRCMMEIENQFRTERQAINDRELEQKNALMDELLAVESEMAERKNEEA